MAKGKYTEHRLSGLKPLGGPKLEPGEMSAATRVRGQSDAVIWWSGLTAEQRGAMVAELYRATAPTRKAAELAERAEKVRADLATGNYTQKELAARYGLSEGTISKLAGKQRNWRTTDRDAVLTEVVLGLWSEHGHQPRKAFNTLAVAEARARGDKRSHDKLTYSIKRVLTDAGLIPVTGREVGKVASQLSRTGKTPTATPLNDEASLIDVNLTPMLGLAKSVEVAKLGKKAAKVIGAIQQGAKPTWAKQRNGDLIAELTMLDGKTVRVTPETRAKLEGAGLLTWPDIV